MRRLAVLPLFLAACNEPAALRPPPMDRFAAPISMATTTRADGGEALLVASGNYNLQFDGAIGGTVLSVDPDLRTQGGSAGTVDRSLVKLGQGAQMGSYASQMVVLDATTCQGYAGAPQVLVPTRFDSVLNVLPLGTGATAGRLDPCAGAACAVGFDSLLTDPWTVTLACRPVAADPARIRQTVFVGFQQTGPLLGYGFGLGWLAAFDANDLGAGGRPLLVGTVPVADATYDATSDRLITVGRPWSLTAPLQVLDLGRCIDPTPEAGSTAVGSCPMPVVHSVDLNTAVRGLDLQAVGLSNPQPGLRRRAYVAARLYDPAIASIIGGRPPADIGGALLVVDLESSISGGPAGTVLRAVPTGTGPAQLKVLPVRPAGPGGAPRRDLVVVTSSTDGMVTLYDDDDEVVATALHLDPFTGAPAAGRLPYALAVGATTGAGTDAAVTRVYVAAFDQALVSLFDVPLANPTQAHLVRDQIFATPPDGTRGHYVRIGGLQ